MQDDDVRAQKTRGEEKTEAHETVPREAENFEHEIRRLIARRDARRAANPALYR